MRRSVWFAFLVVMLPSALAGPALAQDDEVYEAIPEEPETEPEPEPEPEPASEPEPEPAFEPEPEPEPEPASDPVQAPGPTVVHVHTTIEAPAEEEEEEEEEPSPFDPHEAEGDQLYHFGAFVRALFVPQYGQNFFVAGGNDALLPAAGVFFNYRQDGFNFITEVWGASFYNQAPYRGLNETEFETEWIESELRVLFVSLIAMFSIPITSFLAIEIGGGLGFGGVFGDLWRTEAYPDGSAAAGWTPCAQAGDPAGGDYCDAPVSAGGDGSYQRATGQSEPYNFEGGVPPLWFWVELPRIAVRFKPIRQLQLRAEAGFVLYGFHLSASLAIGF